MYEVQQCSDTRERTGGGEGQSHTPLTQAENLLGLYSALRALMTTVFRSIEHFMSAVAVTFTRRSTDAPQPGKGPMTCASMAFCASERSFRPAAEGTLEPEAELPASACAALSGGDAGGDADADGLELTVRPLRRGIVRVVSFLQPGRCFLGASLCLRLDQEIKLTADQQRDCRAHST